MYQITSTERHAKRKAKAAFTLAETVIAVGILALVMSGFVYGYTQTTYRAGWSSMSLVAQSLALESIERARAAQWAVYTLGSSGGDQLPPGTYTNIWTNAVFLPFTGRTITVTNYLQITSAQTFPPIRQIRSDCVWEFSPGHFFTNTVVTLRGGN